MRDVAPQLFICLHLPPHEIMWEGQCEDSPYACDAIQFHQSSLVWRRQTCPPSGKTMFSCYGRITAAHRCRAFLHKAWYQRLFNRLAYRSPLRSCICHMLMWSTETPESDLVTYWECMCCQWLQPQCVLCCLYKCVDELQRDIWSLLQYVLRCYSMICQSFAFVLGSVSPPLICLLES